MYFFSVSSIRAFGTAPTIWSTGFPFLKTSKVGIAMMSNLPDVRGSRPCFNFPKATFPLYSLASASITGETRRHGPHQVPSSRRGSEGTSRRRSRSWNRHLYRSVRRIGHVDFKTGLCPLRYMPDTIRVPRGTCPGVNQFQDYSSLRRRLPRA